MATKKEKEVGLQIPPMNLQNAEFRIVGTSPLIVHKFSEKAQKMISDKQQLKSKEKRSERDPKKEFEDALYIFPDGSGRTGFPAVGFKASMIRAGKQLGFVMKDLQSWFMVYGTDGTDLVEIEGDVFCRTDMIRVATGGADIRYRPEYKKWEAVLKIKYNASVISSEQLAQLIETAGFGCGVGEWRPEKAKTGNFGTFELLKKEVEDETTK